MRRARGRRCTIPELDVETDVYRIGTLLEMVSALPPEKTAPQSACVRDAACIAFVAGRGGGLPPPQLAPQGPGS